MTDGLLQSALEGRGGLRWPGRLVERALGLTALARLHAQTRGRAPFCDAALEVLDLRVVVEPTACARVPSTGPLIVVANHPTGCADGLAVLSLVGRARADVKLLGNYLLTQIPELQDVLIPVDPFASRARSMNAAAARTAIRWLIAGGALVVFPSGEVSPGPRSGGPSRESAWSHGPARLARRARAPVLPIYLGGHASLPLRIAARIHPSVRTTLLARELLWQTGRRVEVHVGTVIPAERLAHLSSDERATAFLRARTFELARAALAAPRLESEPVRVTSAIAPPVPPDSLAREIAALPREARLLESGPFDVLLARAGAIPRTLDEIGRLRELAFRAAGEGSGHARDVDAFDAHYRHLFVWHREARTVAGAYRVGATDEILPRHGLGGLYTSTLFRYDERLVRQINPALELGRAFVTPEYQRDYSPLLLLWKGIARFVVLNPRYRMLFGPVSISHSYQSVSRQILARFLYATSYRPDLGALVEGRNPPAFLRLRGETPREMPASPGPVARSLSDVSALLAALEQGEKGVPVLVRQYLKLNARLLAFTVDASFGEALDGLMIVDLAEVDRHVLARYMGAAAANAYFARHGRRDDARRAS